MRVVMACVLLGGCGDEAGYPPSPVNATVVLTDGDKLICSDQIFKIGLPSSGGPAFPMVVGFGRRWFTCEIEHDPRVAKPKKNGKQDATYQPPVVWQKVKSTTILHTPLGTIVREPPSYP